jgi:PD-(D/E)XK nuclease superfamily
VSAHDDHIDADPHNLLPLLQSGAVRVLRQSTLGTADTCLKRLEFDLDPSIAYTTGEARAVGTGYHAGLELYYRRRMNDDGPVKIEPGDTELDDVLALACESFMLESETDGFEWQHGPDAALAKIDRMLRSYFHGAHYWPADYRVVGVEHTFLWPLSDGWITKGTVDLLVEQPDTGWLIIDDHKSAKRRWKRGKESHRSTNQPAWYTHFIRQVFDRPDVAFVFDVMTYDGEFERRQVQVEPQHVAGVLAKAETVCGLIERDGPFPPNTASFLCDRRWCDHFDRCPWGSAFDDAPANVSVEFAA